MSLVSVISKTAAETIWPTRCVVCDEHGALLCKKCISKINFIDSRNACSVCGEPFGVFQCCGCSPVHANLAEEDRDSYKMEFDRCISATLLDANTGRIVTLYKDAGERRLAKVMAYFMIKYLPPELINSQLLVTYIPATKEAVARRGFDHTKELAQIIASKLGKYCLPLLEPPESSDQRVLGRQMRNINMTGTFTLQRNIYNSIDKYLRWENILIVDDVLTTGATLNAASFALHNAGFKNIICITFARTY